MSQEIWSLIGLGVFCLVGPFVWAIGELWNEFGR